MAEPSLNLAMDDLRGEIGDHLGWGRTPSAWSARKVVEVNNILASALRKFYFQAMVTPTKRHLWSFLRPVLKQAITDGVSEQVLPDDFGGFEGRATLTVSGSGPYWPLQQASEEEVRVLFSQDATRTGRPLMFCQRARQRTTEDRSSRFELVLFPIPDQDYTFECAYSIIPEMLTERSPWAYGGAPHAETLKAGARAAAEIYKDAARREQQANYENCLAASIGYDRQNQPKTLGINSDTSDAVRSPVNSRAWPFGLCNHPFGIGSYGVTEYS